MRSDPRISCIPLKMHVMLIDLNSCYKLTYISLFHNTLKCNHFGNTFKETHQHNYMVEETTNDIL